MAILRSRGLKRIINDLATQNRVHLESIVTLLPYGQSTCSAFWF